MGKQLLLDEHRLLKRKLDESLQKKHVVEMSINKQFEKLKKLEISLEKMRATGEEDIQSPQNAL